MDKETYLWILFVVAVAAVSAYLIYSKYYPSQSMSISVGFVGGVPGNLSVYPYQRVNLTVYVNNTGTTPITDMGVGTLVNGNTTYVYGVSVPPGKIATFGFNYTPDRSGVYNLSVVADPSGLYSIKDRQGTMASVRLDVMQSQEAEAFRELPSNGMRSFGSENLKTLGFLFYSYLSKDYNISQFNMTGMPGLDAFMTPFLTVVGSAVENTSVAHADYYNSSSVYSIWLAGYLKPGTISVGAKGMGLNSTQEDIGGRNVTLVELKYNESLCSWYSNGWIKMLASAGSRGCAALLSSNVSRIVSLPNYSVRNPFGQNYTVGTYRGFDGNSVSAGYTGFVGNESLMYAGVSTGGAAGSSICMGTIQFSGNESFCSEYVAPLSGGINATALVRTRAEIAGYNLTALSLVNTSKILDQIPVSVGILGAFNISGKSVRFTSGILNVCSFSSAFGCRNASFSGNALHITVVNAGASNVSFVNATCDVYGSAVAEKLGQTIAPGENVTLELPCYEAGKRVASMPAGMLFNLNLNYTSDGTGYGSSGSAYVIG